MTETPSSLLKKLEALRGDYGGEVSGRRLELLRQLERRRFQRRREIFRYHEVLCFLRAYPDDSEVLTRVESILASFSRRPDLRRHRAALADSGIAGTEIYYRFYWITACWLASRWPEHLSIDWTEFEKSGQLMEILDLLVSYSESPALDMIEQSPREWIDQLRGPGETDAVYLIERFERLAAEPPVQERLYEQLDVPLRLGPGSDTPSRTRARYDASPVVFQRSPLVRSRPPLRREIEHGPTAVRELSLREGRRLIDLSREAMVTRSRDLDAFAYADPRDVRIIDFDQGLQFAMFGRAVAHRLLLETSYGFLTLKNGVPIGYTLASTLFRSAEIAYNVFDTFRDGEAALFFVRFLSLVTDLFGSDTFGIDPYQLGYGNQEGLRSGAWWFYYKMGFRPRDPDVRRILRGELERMKKNPRHRSDMATLEKLASEYLFCRLGRPRKDVLGLVPLGNIGLRLSAYLAERFGADRESGTETCDREAAKLLRVDQRAGFSAGERLTWRRWAPLVLCLPGVERWTSGEKRALVAVIRAKGGRRESDFVLAFDRHPRLGKALLELSKEGKR
jgi:hypothetical protein